MGASGGFSLGGNATTSSAPIDEGSLRYSSGPRVLGFFGVRGASTEVAGDSSNGSALPGPVGGVIDRLVEPPGCGAVAGGDPERAGFAATVGAGLPLDGGFHPGGLMRLSFSST